MSVVRYQTTVKRGDNARVYLPFPFDADEIWGRKPMYRLAGTINGMRVRGALELIDGGLRLVPGPTWRRDNGIEPGARVSVVLAAKGPQRSDVVLDIAEALEAEPTAAAFFDSLAQFYRTAFLKWINGAKRRPDVRAARVAEMVERLNTGQKTKRLDSKA